MRSSVIISRDPKKADPGGYYEITVIQANGRHITGLAGGSGKDLGEVAGRAAMYAACHNVPNPSGGDIVGPSAIMALIPEHLHNIPPKSQRPA